MKASFTSATAMLQLQYVAAKAGVIGDLAETDPDDGLHVVPGAIRRALAELRLLHSVPFSYLVPDASLLPPESIRFFYLDRNWTDALVDGVLSIGTFTSAERAQLEALREVVRAEVDEAERVVRQPGGEQRLSGPGGAVSGFLLRSRLVSGWPGLHVRGYRDRPAGRRRDRARVGPRPAQGRCGWNGSPRRCCSCCSTACRPVVHLEEPRQGIQFGAIRPEAEPLSTAPRAAAAQRRDRQRPGQHLQAGAVPPRQRRRHAHAAAARADRLGARHQRRRQQRSLGRRQRVRAGDAAVPLPAGVRRPGQRAGQAGARRVPADGVLQHRDGHQERHEIRQPRAALHRR